MKTWIFERKRTGTVRGPFSGNTPREAFEHLKADWPELNPDPFEDWTAEPATGHVLFLAGDGCESGGCGAKRGR